MERDIQPSSVLNDEQDGPAPHKAINDDGGTREKDGKVPKTREREHTALRPGFAERSLSGEYGVM